MTEPIRSPDVQGRALQSGRRLKIRPAVFDDYEGIAAVQTRNGLTPPPKDAWMGLWLENPAYINNKGWNIGWVVLNSLGEITGSISNLPVIHWFQGRQLRVATGCGWAADPMYRAGSMMLLNSLVHQPGVDLILCTTVGPDAEQGMKYLQLSRVPVGKWDQSSFWITHASGFARALLSKKAVPMAPLIRYPLALTAYCHEKLTAERIPDGNGQWQVSAIEGFDERFDGFWSTLLAENPKTLLAERTPETLRWHFRSRAWNRTGWVLGAFEKSRLSAYAVFDRSDNTVHGLKRVRLVDFQALQGSSGALGPILKYMLAACRRDGFDVLEVSGSWLERVGGEKILAPYSRTLSSWSQYYLARHAELAEELKNPACWNPTLFDGDASIY